MGIANANRCISSTVERSLREKCLRKDLTSSLLFEVKHDFIDMSNYFELFKRFLTAFILITGTNS